eukprot:TRINITY_DN11273_c0_g1_i1.p1 TRINITY_DN11273_c0_g1~~TRINITY_DN11273_c0_g1_i1.p1  ORF type:complete len:480 (+),score=61.03 TRINITY_DN11273_c0_g1_i1:72-1511(+)
MIRRPPRSTLSSSSAASDVYKRQAPPPKHETPPRPKPPGAVTVVLDSEPSSGPQPVRRRLTFRPVRSVIESCQTQLSKRQGQARLVMAVLVWIPPAAVVALVAGWIEPAYSLRETKDHIWFQSAPTLPEQSVILTYFSVLLAMRLLPHLLLLLIMAVRLNMAPPKSDQPSGEQQMIGQLLQFSWKSLTEPLSWGTALSQAVQAAFLEEVGFRLLFAHAAMSFLHFVRGVEHTLGSVVGVVLAIIGALIAFKEVAVGDPIGGQNDDPRLLKKIGTGLVLVALGIFQMHTWHVNGSPDSAILHVFHTDEAHRALAGHNTLISPAGVQIPVLDRQHNHHEVDSWVHLYGSNGLIHYLAELLLTFSSQMSLFGAFDVHSSVKHAFVQGSLLANMWYISHRGSVGLVPVVGHIEAWLSGMGWIHCVATHGLVVGICLRACVEVTYTLWAYCGLGKCVASLKDRGYDLFEWDHGTPLPSTLDSFV